MKEFLLFIFVLALHFYFERNYPNSVGQYSLYLMLGTALILIYRGLRYSS